MFSASKKLRLVPTLVLHRRLDRAVRIEAGRNLASHIQGARFIELEGADHWFFAGVQEPVIEAIRGFIADIRLGPGLKRSSACSDARRHTAMAQKPTS